MLTWPLATVLTSRLGALQGPGDPYLNLWILGWGLRAWTMDPFSVLSGRVFNANIFFPAEGTLAYSDHFLLQALVFAPVYAVTQNAVLCYNLLLLASIALSGVAMHACVRAVTGSERGAYIAGLAWACWPYRTAHLLHIQLQALYFMPLAALCLHRVVARGRWRDVTLLGVATAAQVIASVYYGLMTAVLLAIGSATLAWTTGQARSVRFWSRLGAAGVLALLLSAPLLLPYWRTQQTEGFGRSLFEAANHSASLQAYTQVPPENLLYGRTGLMDPRPPAPGARDRRQTEHQLFPGFVLIALAIVGVARGRRSDARPLIITAAALTMAGVVLSLGPEGWRGFYAALHENVFGFQAIRAPARFAVIAVFGVCLLAAIAVRGRRHSADAARRRFSAAYVLCLALLGLEYLNAPLLLAVAPRQSTAVGRWLAAEPLPGAVLHLPITTDIENTPYMVQSLEHGRRLVNGYSGQRPPFYTAVVDSLLALPAPHALATLRELDVRFVVSPSALAGGAQNGPLIERAHLDAAFIYEVRWTPEAIAALEDRSPPPPPPGPAPFSPGETAVYEVFWESGPMQLPAGQATLTVVAGPPATDGWTFEARAETAGWVSTFFTARDRFVTTADRELLPIEHRREIREGRRQLHRTYRYDREAGTVVTDAVTHALGPTASRDALTALYYVRTLPLQPDTSIDVPLNEAGTGMRLQVTTVATDVIERGGLPVPALRLEPRLMRRIERRQPIAMTLWLSTDARRVPLRVLVEAGFGRVRLELVHVRATERTENTETKK